MFESREQIVSELAAAGLGSYAERIGELAQPYLHFTTASTASGVVRLGGSPEWPAGTSWPCRAALPHVDTLKATRLRNDRLADVWGVPCPLTFLAQVDLSMAAAAYPGPWPLPSRGRLSFFWDPLCGCYGQGVANTRVIWDDTDASQVVPLDHPIADYPSDVADLPPVMPARSVDLKPAWSCPSRDMMRWLVSDEKLQEVLTANRFQAFYWRSNEDTFKDRSHRHRMLGWCTPTMWGEPAFEAAAEAAGTADFPVKRLTREAIAPLQPAMTDWLLLLQLDLTDAYQKNLLDGMVYFMIPRDDAQTRRFDRTTAVFQGTWMC